ncbi:arrestin domain-containing protein 2 isoform X2 [Patella vulgata]|uniref:arrestin domain-containing protein 2 isoform X2 n=1 Tax=Patella vulgata TaxID=6465 RepID=UPI0024A89C47|nr:arrestin domain-containing protein 2 isoform X2 [Patella vulgata]
MIQVFVTFSQDVYYPGQLIQGRVIIEVKKEETIRGNQTLSTGRNVYPFQYQLPGGIPSSFQGQYGGVQYRLKCVVDSPFKQVKIIADKKISVIHDLDLNSEPQARESPLLEKQLTLSGGLYRTPGRIKVAFKLNQCGYVPGESIPIHATVQNESSKTLKGSSVCLKQVVKYHAENKTKVACEVITKLSRGRIKPGGEEVWEGESLMVPQVPVSRLPACSFIEIFYVITFIVDVGFLNSCVELSKDILIGSVPLRIGDGQREYDQHSHPSGTNDGILQSKPGKLEKSPTTLSRPVTPPPSYDEVVLSEKHTLNKSCPDN